MPIVKKLSKLAPRSNTRGQFAPAIDSNPTEEAPTLRQFGYLVSLWSFLPLNDFELDGVAFL
jgi:hypothetical protein